MNPAEVVVGEAQVVCRPKVLPLFAEAVRQPGEPPHLHTQRGALAFSAVSADFAGTGNPHDWASLLCVTSRGLYPNAAYPRRTVLDISGTLNSIPRKLPKSAGRGDDKYPGVR